MEGWVAGKGRDGWLGNREGWVAGKKGGMGAGKEGGIDR